MGVPVQGPIAPVRRPRPANRDMRARDAVEQWADDYNGSIHADTHPDRNVYERYRLELYRKGLDRNVRGANWDEAYERAAKLVARDPEFTSEGEDDDGD